METTDIRSDISAPPPKTLTRKERIIPVLISVFSTGIFLILVAVVVSSSGQWPLVQRQFFSWEAMKESFPAVLFGFWLNIKIFVIAEFFITFVSLFLAIARSLKSPMATPIRVAAIVFIDAVRGVPALLLVLLFGFGIPSLKLPGLPNSALFWGTVALIINYSAYTSEVYRSGMEAVHDSQYAAARGLGLTSWQTLRFAIIPQAIRNVLPALLNGAVSLQKDVALLSVIGVREAVRASEIYTARTFNYSSLIVAAGLFLLASVPLARITDKVSQRDQERRLQRTR
ncbi:MAG: ABC transporter permease [Anaerolineales bacterium]|jgi:polar amino acid transport system permease protein|nr:MAG: ABC transporter permease [Anaerolineales bacterium]